MLGVARTHGAERRAYGPSAHSWSPTGYDFLLRGLVDRATLARAYDLAQRCGVHPHQVLIANGWLSAEAYYQALAQACALPFTNALTADETAPPSPRASPRDCLARGLVKHRARAGGFVLAPEQLSPNALRDVLARLRPH